MAVRAAGDKTPSSPTPVTASYPPTGPSYTTMARWCSLPFSTSATATFYSGIVPEKTVPASIAIGAVNNVRSTFWAKS